MCSVLFSVFLVSCLLAALKLFSCCLICLYTTIIGSVILRKKKRWTRHDVNGRRNHFIMKSLNNYCDRTLSRFHTPQSTFAWQVDFFHSNVEANWHCHCSRNQQAPCVAYTVAGPGNELKPLSCQTTTLPDRTLEHSTAITNLRKEREHMFVKFKYMQKIRVRQQWNELFILWKMVDCLLYNLIKHPKI